MVRALEVSGSDWVVRRRYSVTVCIGIHVMNVERLTFEVLSTSVCLF